MSGNFGKAILSFAFGALVVAGFAVPAQADLIIKVNGVTKASDLTDNDSVSFNSVVANYNLNIGLLGADILAPGDLFDTGVSALLVKGHTTGSIDITLTETNLSAGAIMNVMALLSGDVTSADVTRTLWLDPTNHGLESIDLGSVNSNCGPNCTSGGTFADLEHLSGLFSLTEDISITAKGRGALLSSDDNGSYLTVPEPTSLSMLGAGLFAAGWVGIRRRKTA